MSRRGKGDDRYGPLWSSGGDPVRPSLPVELQREGLTLDQWREQIQALVSVYRAHPRAPPVLEEPGRKRPSTPMGLHKISRIFDRETGVIYLNCRAAIRGSGLRPYDVQKDVWLARHRSILGRFVPLPSEMELFQREEKRARARG